MKKNGRSCIFGAAIGCTDTPYTGWIRRLCFDGFKENVLQLHLSEDLRLTRLQVLDALYGRFQVTTLATLANLGRPISNECWSKSQSFAPVPDITLLTSSGAMAVAVNALLNPLEGATEMCITIASNPPTPGVLPKAAHTGAADAVSAEPVRCRNSRQS